MRPIPLRNRLALGLCLGLLGVLGVECVVRVGGDRLGLPLEQWRARREHARAGEPEHYTEQPHVLYRLHPGPGVNSLQFADVEWQRERTAGVTRVACLGGSTTQNGFGADRRSYPEQLAGMLRERTGRPVEVMNWGIDGWTTAETLVNFHLNVLDYDPDVVVVLHGINDVWPRLWPGFRNDYGHYRSSWRDLSLGPIEGFFFRHSAIYGVLRLRNDDSMQLASRVTRSIADRAATLDRAELRPETAVPFEENLRNIVETVRARGKVAVLLTMKTNPYTDWCRPAIVNQLHEGTKQHNEIVRRIAADTGAVLVDVERAWEQDFEGRYMPEFSDIVHVSERGNRWQAELVADALMQAGALDWSRRRPQAAGVGTTRAPTATSPDVSAAK